MSGIVLTSDAVDGVLAGVGHSIDMLEGTINNQYAWTLATMFIGFAIVVGVVMFLLKGHRRI